MRNAKDWLVLVGFILCSQAAGIVGSLFTTPVIGGWYATLVRPVLAPPNWIFGPVWTTLFFLMGVAAFLVWQKGVARHEVKVALGIFLFQLMLNTLWSIIFFGFRNPGGAFLEIVFLWLAIVTMMVAFWRISKWAALLLLPYILWVSFAAYLNFSFWQLN